MQVTQIKADTIPVVKVNPRPYQIEAIAAIKADWERGIQRTAIQAATGSGKTLIFSFLAQEELERGHNVLILVHRDELLQQAIDKFDQVTEGMYTTGVVKAGKNEVHARVVVASIQTLCRSNRLQELLENNRFSLVIADECHHYVSASYFKVIKGLGCFDKNGPKFLGVSATLRREDDKVLADLIQNVCYEVGIADLIKQSYLKNIKALAIRIADLNLDNVGLVGGDFAQGALGSELERANAPKHIVAAYKEHCQDRKTAVFMPSVRSAYKVAEAFNLAGIPSEGIDGSDSIEVRRQKLANFSSGITKVLVNCALLTEGWDSPDVNCIILGAPTKSRTRFVQILGRGLRKFPGQTDCIFLDVVGSSAKHTLISAANLWGVNPRNLAEDGLIKALQAKKIQDIIAANEEEERANGFRVAIPVDMFRNDESSFSETAFQWLKGERNNFLLTLPSGVVEVFEEKDVLVSGGGTYGVRVNGKSQPELNNAHILATGQNLGYAQGIAEDYVRRVGATSLAAAEAPWRTALMTPMQSLMLSQLGVNVQQLPANFSKGEASNLITVKKNAAPDWRQAAPSAKQMWFLRSKGINPYGMNAGQASDEIKKLKENPIR